MWVQWWSCTDGSVTRFSWPITTTPQMRRHTTWWFAIDRSTYFRLSLVFWHKYFIDTNNSQGNVATHVRCGNVVGYLSTTLLQIYCWVCVRKKFENQTLYLVKLQVRIRCIPFYGPRCRSGIWFMENERRIDRIFFVHRSRGPKHHEPSMKPQQSEDTQYLRTSSMNLWKSHCSLATCGSRG